MAAAHTLYEKILYRCASQLGAIANTAGPKYETHEETKYLADSSLFYQDISSLRSIIQMLRTHKIEVDPAA